MLLNYRDTEVAKKHGHLEQLKVPRLTLNLRNGVSLLSLQPYMTGTFRYCCTIGTLRLMLTC